ncbi:MAG: glycosyltransferase family 39 protein [Deltaproteobacteria bacterium]|nr:glycosyltransferase family 39 protein [Nannocystaceae bacterium]
MTPIAPRQLAALAWLAALVAVVLGSWGLSSASLWLDETFTVFDARRSLADMLAMRGEAFGGAHHPPGYFLVVRGAMAVCGTHEVCVRAPSVLANAALAAVIVLAAGRSFGRVAAIAAALVWPSLPYALKYAQQARHYSLLGLLCALALMHAMQAWSREGPREPQRTFVALGLCAGLALWVHLFAVPFLVGLALWCGGWQLALRRSERAPSLSECAIAIGTAVLTAAPLLPGLWKVWVTAGGGQLESRAGPVENAAELARDLLTFGLDSWWVPLLAAPALLHPRTRVLAFGLALVAVFPLSGVLLRNPEHFVALRYFMPSLAVVAVLQAAGVAVIFAVCGQLASRLVRRGRGVLGLALATALLAWPVRVLARLHVAGIAKQYATADFEPWDRVAARIRVHAVPGDLTVVVPYALVRYPFLVYGLPTPLIDPDDPELAAQLAACDGTVFVVASHIDRDERTALRRRTLRTITAAGFVRSELDAPREANIELLAYRRRPSSS